MKALIVYDSKFGNTEKIAQAIAAALGTAGDVRLVKINTVTLEDIKGWDILLVGSPTHAWGPSKATKSFIKSLKPGTLSNIKAAAFDTGYRSRLSGSAAKKIEEALLRAGGAIVAEAMRFVVNGNEGPLAQGELDRASNWGRKILETFETKAR